MIFIPFILLFWIITQKSSVDGSSDYENLPLCMFVKYSGAPDTILSSLYDLATNLEHYNLRYKILYSVRGKS